MCDTFLVIKATTFINPQPKKQNKKLKNDIG